MNTKKRISLILAAMMSLSILAAGCKKTDEVGSALDQPESTPVVSELTEMTTTTTEATTTTAPETEAETETETEAETEAETEETTVSTEETTVTSEETEAASETTAAREWNETEVSEVMYTTQACYSRVKAIVGAETVAQYTKGTKVNVVAATDTGYYKLADGSFIHSDYLTDEKPAAVTTAKPKPSNNNEDAEEIFDDDSNSSTGSEENTGSSVPAVSSSAYNKSYKDRYVYKQLTSTEQELYRNIVSAVENFAPTAKVPDGMMLSDIKKVFINVFNQEPQLFWMGSSINVSYNGVNISYEYTKEEAAAMQKKVDSYAANVIAAANKYSSTTSKLKVFYDYIIKNNDFEKTGSSAGGACSIYNGLTGSTIQCLGYAKTMMYLCDLAGIECMVVTGTPYSGGSHAWNVVYCDNGYYNLDTTWGDPIGAPGGANYLRYSFFLVPDSWLEETHLDVNEFKFSNGSSVHLFDAPSCTKTACNYFKAYGKEYSDLKSADAAMYEAFDTAVKNGKNVAEIRVTTYELFDTLMNDKHAVAYQKYAKGLSKDVKKLSRQRSDNEGVYVVQYNIYYN